MAARKQRESKNNIKCKERGRIRETAKKLVTMYNVVYNTM